MYEQIVAWWQTKNIQTDADLEEAFNGHVISFAYNSGNIENPNVTYHDTCEIFAAFNERKPIDENLIKEIQKRLTLNTYDPLRWKKGERPGEYKKGDYVTGKNETGAWLEDVPDEMQELIEDIGDVDDKNALTAAAFFHAKFENIHPFADGNGRTGRLVMNYLLVIHNHPPIVIHQEDRKAYFDALEAWDEEQNLQPLKDFLRAQTVKTWEKQVLRRRR